MRCFVALGLILSLLCLPVSSQAGLTAEEKAYVAKAKTFEQDGWIYLYVEGKPFEIGFQNGYLLASDWREWLTAQKKRFRFY